MKRQICWSALGFLLLSCPAGASEEVPRPGELAKSLGPEIPGPDGWELGHGEAALGRLDEDAAPDLVFGCHLTCGLQRVDLSGRSHWKVDGRVDGFLLMDLDGDGLDEIVVELRGGELAVLDRTGEIASTARIEGLEESDPTSVLRWPPATGPYRLFLADRKRGRIRVLDLTGGEMALLEAPGLPLRDLVATPVRFVPGPHGHLVLLSPDRSSNRDRCPVLVYDHQGAVVWTGAVDDRCGLAKAVPGGPDGRERDLIGGKGRVWQLSLRDAD